jgi:Dehydrogenase E1 component
MSKLAEFAISSARVIDTDGTVIAALPAFAREPRELVALYRAMVLTRTFDAKAIALQRTGRLGTYASSLGQEAVSVGVAAAMQAVDVLLPSFREHGAQLWRGVGMKELFLYWGGDERGNDFAGPREDFPKLRPGRLTCAARRRGGVGLQAARRKAGSSLHVRRRCNLEGRRRGSLEHDHIADRIRANTRLVLEASRRDANVPRVAALALAVDRVRAAMQTRRWR